MSIRRYQAFISATQKDLSEERAAVTWECLKLGFIPVGMENFSATTDRGWKTIEKTIDTSDYYVVIVAGRYGSIDEETGTSWTEREYDYAVGKGMKVLAFIRELSAMAGNDVDDDKTRVNAFRDKLKNTHLIEKWTTAHELRACVSTALSKARQEDEAEGTLPPGWYRGPAPDVAEFARLSAEARELRDRLAASAPVASKHVEKLRRLPLNTPISARWSMYSGGYNNGDFLFQGIDEVNDVIKLQSVDQRNVVRQMPLDKIDTLFPVGNGSETWRLTLNAWQ